MNTKLAEKIEEIGTGFNAFTETTGAKVGDLEERLGRVEASNDRPKSNDKPLVQPYRELFTTDGKKAYVLNSKQRFSDVPELAGNASGVSLARVLGAMAFGSNCGDAEAVKFAN